jgi:hypothetical protein
LTNSFANYNRNQENGVVDSGTTRGSGGSQFFVVPGDGIFSLLVACLAQGVGEPLETLVKTVSRGGASRLDVLHVCQQESSSHNHNMVKIKHTQARCLRL